MLERRRESDNFGRMKRVYRPSGERDYEITPEVIRAGRRELTDDVARDLYDSFLNPEDVAVSVYRAMLQAHEKTHPTRIRQMDRGNTTQGIGNLGENVDSYFHPLPSSLSPVHT